MRLLDILSIKARLDERFLPLEPMLSGMRLVSKADQQGELIECEKRLGVRFPESFAELAAEYDFGQFSIGPVAFGYKGNYFEDLAEVNRYRDDVPAWWGSGQRPAKLVMVAYGELFAYLLDTASERILAYEHGEDVSAGSFTVADRFEHFVRGLGTVMLERAPGGRNDDLASSVAESVGVEPNNRF